MIEVGDYVRNEDGYIQKINIFDKEAIFKDKNGDLRICEGEDVYGNEYSALILKHSKNIIDLIEVGDFIKISYDNIGDSKHFIDNEFALNMIKEDLNKFKDKRIKEILTKEQYNVNCFRLEE